MNADNLVPPLERPANMIPLVLIATTSEEFIEQFRDLYRHPDAIAAVGVVYVWATERPIPRLRGESNIIYIGKTDQSLSQRHSQYATSEGTGDNWARYDHIIRKFGAIRVFYSVQPNPTDAERMLLRKYFDDHLDIPPLNRRSV